MPWTHSLLEHPTSPLDVGSGEARQISVDLTNYLNGGTINSPTVTIFGGPLMSDDIWTNLTSTVLNGVASVSGSKVLFSVHSLTSGFGYKTFIAWQNLVSGGDTYQRFVILRCSY